MRRRTAISVIALIAAALVAVHAHPPTPRTSETMQTARPANAMMASVDPALFKGMAYRLVGPSRGGRVTTVTGVPSEPRTFYMGVASGGLFKTTDGGATWMPITDGQVPLGSTGAVAVANSDPSVVYLGTGSDDVRSNVSTGRGIYTSKDAGKTWRFSGLYNAGQTGAIRIHPTNPNIAWAAMQGDAFKNNPDRGVFKTTDGGATWRNVLFVSDSVGAMAVEVQPDNPNVVYAWMSHLQRKPWTIISGANAGGFYKSADGGDHFTRVSRGLPTELIGKANLAVTNANPNRVYALIESKTGDKVDGGLFRSEDAGESFALINSNPQIISRPFYYLALAADPTNADVVYMGAENFYKSADGGKTLQPMRLPHGDHHDMWISPRDGNVMIQSNDGGANISTDGGHTWSTQMNQPTGEFYGVWLDEQFPYKLYGAQQDDDTVIIKMNADPAALSDWQRGPGCETGPIMPSPKDPQIVYGSCKGQYEVMNLHLSPPQSKNYWIGGQSLYGNPATDLLYRFQRVSPMAISPNDPDVLYYGGQFLFRTRDKGVHWDKISPDLTDHPACCQAVSGEPITRDVTGEEFYSTLYAIAEAPTEKGVIWTGSNDGPFYVTRDDGKTWTNVTPKDLPPGGRVQYIDASPHRKGSAYFAVYRYLLGDYQPYLYKTDDYGKTWKRLTDGTNGIPADTPTRVVREDPNRPGLLYAGTEFGVDISFDDGGHWQPFQLNLPQVPVTDIKIHHRDLVVSTQGRAFWILDNISSLEQLTPQSTPTALTMYKPRDGYRTRTSPQLLGPMIEYYLPAAPDGPVVIDILDAKGAMVTSYNSETAAAPSGGRGRGGRGGAAAAASAGGAGAAVGPGAVPPLDQEAGAGAGGGGAGRGGPAFQTRVTKTVGFNRVVWNVQHSSGLGAPPGNYQARVTVNGQVYTQPFNVLVDPIIAAEGVTAADLQEQFDHNMKMRALTADVTQLLSSVQGARAQFNGDAVKSTQIEAVYQQLVDTPEGVRYNKPGLSTHVRYLSGMTTGADQKIGRDAIERYTTLRKMADDLKLQLEKIVGPGK